MNEKIQKRIAFNNIISYLDEAQKRCREFDDLKDLFEDEIHQLLDKVISEKIKQGVDL